MRKCSMLLMIAGLLLSGCTLGDGSGYGNDRHDRTGYRGVLGDICPPAQALKGYC